MGVYVQFYIDGFTEPARKHPSVVAFREFLKREKNTSMKLSPSEGISYPEYFQVDDGLCHVQSDARDKSNYQEMVDEQIAILKRFFPDRNIYKVNDLLGEGDRSLIPEVFRGMSESQLSELRV